MNDQWLSNTYLVGRRGRRPAVLIDAGGPVEPLLEVLDAARSAPTHVLLTHHHHDHVAELDDVLERRCPDAGADPPARARAGAGGHRHDRARRGDPRGGLEIEPLHTPGHTAGMLSLLVNGTDVFTGDTLFKGSVGGVRAPGHTTYADLKYSIMDTLLELPPETTIHPGHTDRRRSPRSWSATRSSGSGAASIPRARAVHGARRAGDADPARRRLRRRPQGLGALARRSRRHRPRLAGPERQPVRPGSIQHGSGEETRSPPPVWGAPPRSAGWRPVRRSVRPGPAPRTSRAPRTGATRRSSAGTSRRPSRSSRRSGR